MTSTLSALPSTLRHGAEWARAIPWDRYLEEEVHEHVELWTGVWERSRTPEAELSRLAEVGGRWRLLVLAEDWCGDASNTVPVIARLAGDAPELEMRVLKRDENPGLMDLYLTDGSRSIPLAVVLDENDAPVGRWGPRPAELQAFVIREKRAGARPGADIYRDTRRWYARDRGASTVREIVDAIVAAARRSEA
jgi:hypothetical protein